jgi:type VI secretion system protein ImpA
MNFDKLSEPVSTSAPAGSDCGYTLEFQQLVVFSDYLSARTEVVELERQTKVEFSGENADSDRRSAEANAADGRRKLEILSLAVKEITGRNPALESARSELVKKAELLLVETGKDIRVVQHLTLAMINQEGIAGLEAGLNLIDGLLNQYGALVYPQPDEDDPEDVSARAMVLSEMLSGSGFINALRESVVLIAPGVGQFTGRDAEVMDGSLSDDRSDGARSTQHIRAMAEVLASVDSSGKQTANDVLGQRIEDISRCLDVAGKVSSHFVVGTLHGDRVLKLLQRIRSQLEAALTEGGADSADGSGDGSGQSSQATRQNSSTANNKSGSGSGALQSRDDARRLILEISRFLEQTEPGHPAPLFLKRAERLLGLKDFFAIISDMAPDALSEMEKITGYRLEVTDQ